MVRIKKFRENALYHYANRYRQQVTEEEDLDKQDFTEIFLREIENMVKNGEIIIININAKMRLGKSTLAFAIAQEIIWPLLIQYGHRSKNDKFGMNNVARDHQEHSKMMRDPKTNHTVIVTDESNELENTGENSSIERAQEKVFSDVQAGRYVHRVCCSPKETVDPNADILLSVTSIDKKTMTTHAKLYYRFYEGGHEFSQLLGFIRLPVGPVIKRWVKTGSKLFYKQQKGTITPVEQAKLDKLIEKDWYTKYYMKKHEKMELITKEGIQRPRELDYAKVILDIVNRLKKLTKSGSLLNKGIVKNFVEAEFIKQKIPTSMIGIELTTMRVMGILDSWKNYWQASRKIIKTATKADQGNLEAISELDELKEIRDVIKDVAAAQESTMERYADINKKYNE